MGRIFMGSIVAFASWASPIIVLLSLACGIWGFRERKASFRSDHGKGPGGKTGSLSKAA